MACQLYRWCSAEWSYRHQMYPESWWIHHLGQSGWLLWEQEHLRYRGDRSCVHLQFWWLHERSRQSRCRSHPHIHLHLQQRPGCLQSGIGQGQPTLRKRDLPCGCQPRAILCSLLQREDGLDLLVVLQILVHKSQQIRSVCIDRLNIGQIMVDWRFKLTIEKGFLTVILGPLSLLAVALGLCRRLGRGQSCKSVLILLRHFIDL